VKWWEEKCERIKTVDPEEAVRVIKRVASVIEDMDLPANIELADIYNCPSGIRIEFIGADYTVYGGPACRLYIILLKKAPAVVKAVEELLGVRWK